MNKVSVCRSCGKQVGTGALTCRNCGKPRPGMNNGSARVKIVAILAVIVLGVAAYFTFLAPDLGRARLVVAQEGHRDGKLLVCRNPAVLRSLETADPVVVAGRLMGMRTRFTCRWCDGDKIKSVNFVDKKMARFRYDIPSEMAGSGLEEGYWYTWRANILTPSGQPTG